MDRLQKKCFFAATGLHLLLLLILLIGPAFVSPRSQPDNMPILDFVPVKTVDALISGGGNPNARPPPAPLEKPLPAPPAPVAKPTPPQPEKVRMPNPPREPKPEVKPPDPKPESLEPSNERKPKKLVIDTTLVIRPAKDAKAEAKARADTQAREEAREQARQEVDRRSRAAAALGNAANSIAEGRSSATKIELKGPGGGGLPYANFLQDVKSAYAQAWIVPDGVADDNATVDVSVTIARDGTVVPGSPRITRASGNAAVDRSVQVTLDRVKYAAPLPDGAKENQRTVTITFSVRAKRLLG